MITFSTKGARETTAFGSPPTPPPIDLEGATKIANSSILGANSVHHRLPVFVSLNGDSSCLPDASGKGSPNLLIPASSAVQSLSLSDHRIQRVPECLSLESTSTFPRTNSVAAWSTCKKLCDDVTSAAFSVAQFYDRHWVEVERPRRDVGGVDPDLSGLPITDQVCPFHRRSSKWLVPRRLLKVLLVFLV